MAIKLENYGAAAVQPDPMAVPPGTRAPIPAAPVQGGPHAPGTAPIISEADALKGGDAAKVNIVSLSDLNGNSGPSGGAGNAVGLGSMVEGKLVLEAVDAMVPALLVLACRALLSVVIKKSDMQLTAKEKDILAPLVQKCMDSIMLNFNSPWTALAVTAGCIYGAKLTEHAGGAVMDKKSKAEPEKKVTLKEKEAEIKEAMTANPPPPPPVPEGLKPFTDEDVKKLAFKKKVSELKARAWLDLNWVKKGGVY